VPDGISRAKLETSQVDYLIEEQNKPVVPEIHQNDTSMLEKEQVVEGNTEE
jgi:hypothetical protein